LKFSNFIDYGLLTIPLASQYSAYVGRKANLGRRGAKQYILIKLLKRIARISPLEVGDRVAKP